MIQSMTGYSRCVRRALGGAIVVELRSTNHRYLEASQRLPEELARLEAPIAQLIRSHIKRGRIEVNVIVQTPLAFSRRVVIDEALVQQYYERLLGLKSRFGLKGKVTIDQLLSLPHILSVKEDHAKAQEQLWPPIRQAVAAALRELVAMRRKEGQRLVKDIRTHTQRIRKRLKTVRADLPKSVARQKQRLRERLKTLVGQAAAGPRAQLQEALAVIKETDIHEELVRLESHLSQAQEALARQESVGKKLDFIAQELMREANTMGAKANDAHIARQVIDIKEAIEKIREQAQNLE